MKTNKEQEKLRRLLFIKETAKEVASWSKHKQYACFAQSNSPDYKELNMTKTSASTYEPDPIPNDSPSMHDLVIEDLKERKQFGLDKYNTTLQAFNGRRARIDKYQELLDAVVYSKQEIEEIEYIKNQLENIISLAKKPKLSTADLTDYISFTKAIAEDLLKRLN